MRKLYLLFCLTGAVLFSAQAQNEYRYWFDNDYATLSTATGGNSLHMDVDVEKLGVGLHSLHIQTVDDRQRISSPKTGYFVKALPISVGELRYWFDTGDSIYTTVKSDKLVESIDVSSLREGVHTFYCQSIGSTPSSARCTYFLKLPQVKTAEKWRGMVYVDGKLCHQEEMSLADGVVKFDFDATALPHGLHNITVQLITSTGIVTISKTSWFLRVNTNDELNTMQCYYMVDDNVSSRKEGVYANGSYHFDLDASSLADGLHRLSCTLVSGDGSASSIRSAFFVKTPLGGNGIAAYEYWLNDDTNGMVRKDLENREPSYDLVEMLPVESCPLRSSAFTFEKSDGKPFIYANNDFNIRFYDAGQRFVSQSATYTDYNVGQEITDAELLISGTPVVKAKPAENEIQWYRFPAMKGDSLAFKVDKACTVQVFAPSDVEAYKVSGTDVVNFGGCRATETGEYYLALHDVTSTQGSTTRLEYQNIHTVLPGDANSDGVVDAQDATLIADYYAQKPDTYLNFEAADVNNDGVIDSQDATLTTDIYMKSGNVARTPQMRKLNIRNH